MVEDHSKANDALKQLAAQKKVMLPPDVLPAHKQAMEKLSKLSGADFDKEYVMAMVKDHEKDVTAFENVSKTAADADVKAFATKNSARFENAPRNDYNDGGQNELVDEKVKIRLLKSP